MTVDPTATASAEGGWLPPRTADAPGVQITVARSGFAEWIDRAIGWVCLFSLVPAMLAASMEAGSLSPVWLAIVAGGLTVVAILMPIVAGRPALFRLLAGCFGAVVLGGLLTWPVAWDDPAPAMRPPWLWLCLGLATICVAVATTVRVALAYNATAAVIYLLIRILPGGGVGLALAVQDVLVLVIQPAGLLLALTLLRESVRQLDEALLAAHNQRTQDAMKDALVTARSRLDAIVHDEVMTTLVTAAHSQEHTESLAQQAREAQASLEEAAASAASDEPISSEQFAWLVQDVVESVSTNGVVSVSSPAQSVHLASDMVGVLVQSVREATLNASKHSQADVIHVDAVVRLVGRRAQVTVVVADDGVGFSLEDVPPQRLGLRVSLFERMRSIGGEAQVDSAPGRGTRVTLTWSSPAEQEPPRRPSRAMLEPDENPLVSRIERRPFRVLGYSLMALYMLVGALCVGRVAQPWLLVLAIAIAPVAVYVAMYDLGLKRMSAGHAWSVIGMGLAITAISLAAMPPGPWPQYTTWFTSAMMLLLIMVMAGPQEGIAWTGAALHAALVLGAALLHPGMTLVQSVDAAIVPGAWLGVCLFLLRWMDQIHRQVQVVEQESTAEASSHALTFSKLVLREVWLTELMGMVGPMLAQIANPEVELTDLDRRMFLAVEGGLRDSIRAANLTSRELSYSIGEARIRGVDITLIDNRGSVLPEPTRRAAIGLLQQLVSAAQGGKIVARVAPDGYDDAVTILRVDEQGLSKLVRISEEGTVTP